MEIQRLTLDEWAPMAEKAHAVCFNEERPHEANKFDFALLVSKDGVAMCYATVFEFDDLSAYMQHGGAFPEGRGFAAFRGYNLIIEYLLERYPRLMTKVKNTNRRMLKLCLEVDFIPNGIEVFGDEVFVRFLKDRK